MPRRHLSKRGEEYVLLCSIQFISGRGLDVKLFTCGNWAKVDDSRPNTLIEFE